MYRVEFYEKRNGTSEVWNFLEELREKSRTNKDARIQYEQIIFYIDLLARNGTRLPSKITKYLEDDIWELRPGNNRIFYFYYADGQYVLLHHFRKKRETITFVSKRREANENMGRIQEACKIY